MALPSTAASLVPRMVTVNHLRGAVGCRHRNAVGVAGAANEFIVGGIHGVGPHAGGVDAELAVAVGTGHVGLRHEVAALSTSVAVSVPPVLCTALVSVRSAVLLPVMTAASLVPRMVTVTLGGGAVATGHRKGVRIGGASDEFIVRAAGNIGPGACRVDAEAAVGASSGGLGHKGGWAVHVADAECAIGAEHGIGFGEVNRGAAQYRRIVGAKDGDGDHLRGAVGCRHRNAVGVAGAANEFIVGGIHGVGPHAGGVDAELAVAVGTGHVGLRHEGRGAVHVGRRECAASALYGIGLGQVGGTAASDDGRIIGAKDGDGDAGGGAVATGHRKGVRIGGASDEFIVRAAGNIGPGACRVDAEAAVGASSGGLGHKGGWAVHVADAECAIGAEHGIGFGEVNRGAAQYRRIVGAKDGDGDHLRGAVGCRHRNAVGVAGAANEFIVGGIHGVGPHAGGVDAELAVAVGTGHVGLRHEGRGAVHVGRRECAASALYGIGLGQVGGTAASDDGRIIGAKDGDGDAGGGAVATGHRKGVRIGGASDEFIVRAAGNIGPGACRVDAEAAVGASSGGLGHKGGWAVHVADAECAIGAEHGIGFGEVNRGAAQYRRIVGAKDGDGDHLRGAVGCRHRNAVGVAGAANEFIVGGIHGVGPHAGGVDAELAVAVGTGHVGLRHEGRGAVHVGRRECAASALYGIGLGQVGGTAASDDGRIIGAKDGDGDAGGGAVATGHRKGVRIGGASDEFIVRAAGNIGPGACRVDAEAAVGASSGGLGHKGGWAVHVADAECAIGAEHGIGFGEVNRGAAQYRRIVGAKDGDGDHLRGAVGCRHRNAVGVAGAANEFIVGGIHGVGPHAGGVDAELAVAVGTGHVGLRHEGRGAVHVGRRECAASALYGIGLGQVGGTAASDDGRIIGAKDGDGDAGGGAVATGHRKGVRIGGASDEFIVRAAGNIGPGACRVDAEAAVGASSGGLGHKGGWAVHVADAECAIGAEHGIGFGEVNRGAAQYRRIVGAKDGDGDHLRGAVGCRHRNAVGVAGAANEFIVGGIHGVGPHAGGVDAELAVAVGTGHVGLRHEGRGAVHVGRRECAASALYGIGLGQVGGTAASDDGRIIGAKDGDGDAGGGAVATGHRKGVRIGGASDEFIVRAAGNIGPGACRVDAEAAVGASSGGLGHKGGWAVHVADAECAIGAEHGIGFGEVNRGAAQYRRIVGAKDGDGDHLRGAVGCRHRNAVGVAGAANEFIVGGIHGVGPHAGGVDAELAVAVGTGHVGLRHEGRGAVHVGRRECAASALYGIGLGQVGGTAASDDGRIIGAKDGDGDAGGGAVATGHRKGVRIGGASDEFIVRAAGNIGPGACRVDAEAAVGASSGGLGHKGGWAVHVADAECAIGAEHGIGFGEVNRGAAQYRRIVGAKDGDGDHLRGAVGCRHRNAVGVAGAANEFIVGGIHGVGPHAGGVDAELAVAVGTGHVGLRHEGRGAVHVGRRECAASALYGIGLGQVGGTAASDDGRIIGAKDGDGDAGGGAVATGHRKGVRIGGASDEFIVRAAGNIGPGACRVDAEAAVGASSGGLGHKGGWAVHVADAECAIGAEHGIGFGEVNRGAAQYRRIVGAKDGDGDHLRGAVGCRHRNAVGVAGAANEFIVGGIHGVGPHAAALMLNLP